MSLGSPFSSPESFELRNESAAVLRDVQAGQRMIITRNGTPVAELRPVSRRRFVPRAVIVEAGRGAPRIDAARFRADLDALADPYVEPYVDTSVDV